MKQPSEKQLHPFRVWDAADEEYYCGYIDGDGNVVIPPIYEIAHDFSEGLACVAELGWDKGYKFINTSGEVVISLDANIYVYDDFHEGLCMVSVDGKSGFIDRTGKMAIPPQFDGADGFDHGVAPVRIGEREASDNWGFIDHTGKFIVQPKYRLAEWPEYWCTKDGLLRLLDGDETYYFDLTGKQIWPKSPAGNH